MTLLTRRSAIAGALATAAAAQIAPVRAQTDAMKALATAAKAEGSIIVDGPPNPAVREMLSAGFMRDYGIQLSYISSGSSASAARVRAERAAGKYLLDVFISGPDTPALSFLPAGWLDKIEPILIAPDVLDKRKWKDGHLWYLDPDHTILRVLQSVVPELVVNTKLVKPSEVSTWKSLLDPKWQGKIVAKDPGITGAGASLTALLYMDFGPDFVKKLYIDQKPLISRDGHQAMQFLATGNYAILTGPQTSDMLEFQKLGYPLAPVFPTDAPSVLTGAFGMICLLNKAPHPNAAKLFINWLAQREPLGKFASAEQSLSLRTDATYEGLPPWVWPQKGVKYFDSYGYKFVVEDRDAMMDKARALLGE